MTFMISNEIHRLRPTRICRALLDYQGNSQIAPNTGFLCFLCSLSGKSVRRCPHTDLMCSSYFSGIIPDGAPHGFTVLCMFFFWEIGPQIDPTRICCALHDFQGNSQVAPHTDSLCSVCSCSGISGHRFPPQGFPVLFMISNEIHRLRPTRISFALHCSP